MRGISAVCCICGEHAGSWYLVFTRWLRECNGVMLLRDSCVSEVLIKLHLNKEGCLRAPIESICIVFPDHGLMNVE